MKVTFSSQWFPPEKGTMVTQIARAIAAGGHDLQVLTGFPNYPEGVLFDGYPLRPYRRDEWEGHPVHRAPLYPSHGASGLGRIANYVSWAAGATLTAQAKVPRSDAWVVYSSPVTAGLPPLLSPRHRRSPVLTIVQDLWPESVTESGMLPGPLSRGPAPAAAGRVCDAIYRHSSLIGVISPGMRGRLTERGVPDDRIVDLPNWISDDHLLPDHKASAEARGALGLPEGFTFLYAGNLGRLQNLPPLIRAFKERPDANLVLLGAGIEAEPLEQLARSIGAANVHFHPPVPFESVGTYIAASDAAVVSLQDSPLMRVTMPSKVQASLAAGRPVLMHAAGDAAAIIQETGAGAVATPGDLSGTLEAIDRLVRASREELAAIGHAARATYLERYSPSAGVQRLNAALDRLVQENHD